MKITIIAVVDVPESLWSRSDEDMLQDATEQLGEWRTHDDLGRFATEVRFVTVAPGVSALAVQAGAEEES